MSTRYVYTFILMHAISHFVSHLCFAEELGNNLSLGDTIAKYGYPYENHSVTTEDGYILTIGRIPQDNSDKKCTSNKEPVILQHGIFQNAESFVLSGPNRSLAFYLSNACYDVWLPNGRGTTYSWQHILLTNKKNEYWDFTYDEEGKYDVKAVVDYVLDMTKAANVSYVGFSTGTTLIMVFLHYNPSYANRIKGAYMLAPIAYWSSAFYKKLPTVLLNVYSKSNHQLFNWPITLPPFYLQVYNEENCGEEKWCQESYNASLIEEIHRAVLVHFQPYPLRQLLLFLQTYASKEFKAYDFGKKQNQIRYGQGTPPLYNLSRVSMPVYLFHGNNEFISTPKDAKTLASQLPDVRLRYQVPIPFTVNIEFLVGSYQVKYVYEVLLLFLENAVI